MPIYSKKSPYADTVDNGSYLDVITFRNIPIESDDVQIVVPAQYAYRPDLLAFDLYGDSNLWWVFSVRNKNIIRDPVYDMFPGQEIYLPKLETMRRVLGI